MSNDRPLTSEEMIRRARQDLNSPPRPDPEFEPTPHLPEAEDDPEPTTHNTPPRTGPSAPRRRRSQRQDLPADPFAARRQGANRRAVSLLVGIAAAIIGIAIALSAISNYTP